MIDTAAVCPALFLQRPGMPSFIVRDLIWRSIGLFVPLDYQGRQGAFPLRLDRFNPGQRFGFQSIFRHGYGRRKAGYVFHGVKPR